ncbi:AtuA-related protein [Haloplanus pelagicus]|jgi:hypothetical protein|uniref:AtuA-related protein n=1 Tax=Haloplanus pelagicus TaxID=2949995 RepID=UPI00203B7E1E|nr:hypothetical protein [Haloplanus sp. HW8-1]
MSDADHDGTRTVRDIAAARAGDKGRDVNVAVVADDDEAFDVLAAVLTEERVADAFGPLIKGDVTRYDLPQLRAFNFVVSDRAAGDVTTTLCQDAHGKSLSYLLLGIGIPDRR